MPVHEMTPRFKCFACTAHTCWEATNTCLVVGHHEPTVQVRVTRICDASLGIFDSVITIGILQLPITLDIRPLDFVRPVEDVPLDEDPDPGETRRPRATDG